jgi:pheromone shutdown protein TraB
MQHTPLCCCGCCCADQLGVQPGAEFRAAAEASAAVPGGQCCLVLGDRPIEITLSRAWEALSWRRRLQLLADLAAAGMMSSKQVITATAQHWDESLQILQQGQAAAGSHCGRIALQHCQTASTGS